MLHLMSRLFKRAYPDLALALAGEDSMKSHPSSLGNWGESLAAEYLRHKGFQIVDQNVYSRYGELDIVALEETREGKVLVFVEVKTRSTTSFGYPEAAVDSHKQQHLLRSARAYCQEHEQLPDVWQIDVISIFGRPGGPRPEMVHFRDICP